jgi:capsule polysaccharide export protein KpsE/RkpR
VLLATLLAVLIPPQYESVTRLMPPDAQSTSGSAMLAALTGRGGDVLETLAGNTLGVKSSGALFVGILRSRTVEDALIRRFDLRGVYWVRRWEDARRELEDRSYIAEDRKSGIIEVHVRDRRPERSQALAKAYVEELDRAVATLSTSAARREREFLETRLTAVKQDLDQAAQDFSQFASKNSAINIPEQGKAMVEAAARLQGQLIAAEAERQGLEQIYTANNVRVRAAQGRIRELREQLNKLGGAYDGPGVSKGEDSLYPSIRKLPLLGVTYADLYRRTKIHEAVFETLTKQYELAKVQEAKEIPTVRVLDPPNMPERRASPPRLFIMFLGLFLSLALTSAWVVGRATWEDTDQQDPRKLAAQKAWSGLQEDVARSRARTSALLAKLRRHPASAWKAESSDRDLRS